MSSSSKRLLEKQSSRGSAKSRSSIRRSLGKKSSSIRAESKEIDSDLIVRDIMEEILGTALEKIHKRYMENQLIKFVVHCAHEALTKVLKIHFYQHNDYVRSFKFWGSDKCLEPSSPDSWAFDQIPLSKNISAEHELNTLSLINLEVEKEGGEIIEDTHLDVVSEPSETLIEDIKAIIDEILENLPTIDEEQSEQSESVVSAFTMVLEGAQHFNKFKMKPQFSRISMGEPTFFRLPKIDLPESGHSRKYQSETEISTSEMEKLPPIRTESSYKYRSLSLQDDKLKKLREKSKL